MFGVVKIRIHFEWINFVKLNLTKNDINVKRFMFKNIYVKMS